MVCVALWFSTIVLSAAPSHPVVAGFDRFHAKGEQPGEGGSLLLAELNCVVCHVAEGAQARKGPILDAVGGRVRPAWIRQFLADPAGTKPGTTMPDMLSGAPDRARAVEALVQYLATTGTPRFEPIDSKAVAAGRATYHKVGCVACHGERDTQGNARALPAGVVPLPDLKAKYTLGSLSAFLDKPHEVRPGGRMPKLLTGKEPREVASFLLQGIKGRVSSGTVNYSVFHGTWEKLPALDKLKPQSTGVANGLDLGVAGRRGDYAVRFHGIWKVDRDDAYKFSLASDDGSRLVIDGKTIIDNDGVHPNTTREGTAELNAGIHKVEVWYFQGGGEDELSLTVQGRHLQLVDFGQVIAASEKDLAGQVAAKPEPDADTIVPDAKLAGEGRALFSSLGCVNCHQLKEKGQPAPQLAKAPKLGDLKGDGGCLAEAPKAGLPRYGLAASQRVALAAGLKAPVKPAGDAERIRRDMTAFNCLACHVRDGRGGPIEDLNKAFQTTQPEMGDEARLPPWLNGVGAKMEPDYFKKIMVQGVDDRPYMQTRMPGFGSSLADINEVFARVDKLPVAPPVSLPETDAKLKTHGRMLVGGTAFGCIKCHTFAGNKAEGVQGIDMAIMTKRVRRDWFFAYVNDPQAVRPGTRMPAAFKEGKSVIDDVLEGKAVNQIEAIWRYLADGNKARLPVGIQKRSIPLAAAKGAVIYRNFIEGAGARGIGVGFAEKVNLAFDANDLRLALLWHGGFIDAARHWSDRGVGFEGPLGDNIVSLPPGLPFARLEKPDSPWPAVGARQAGWRFMGYSLDPEDRPSFRYGTEAVTVVDKPLPLTGDKDPAIKRELSVSGAPAGLVFRAAAGKVIEASGDGWFRVDGGLKVKAGAGARIRKVADKAELLVDVPGGANATISLEYKW